jgi:hypothetical protein
MIQLQQGAAYSDNHRDVSEAAFEADAVTVVIWNTLRTKPEGFARSRKDQEEINKYPTETAHRRPPIDYRRAELPARHSRSVCWSRADRLRDDQRRVVRKRPAQTARNFHTIGGA